MAPMVESHRVCQLRSRQTRLPCIVLVAQPSNSTVTVRTSRIPTWHLVIRRTREQGQRVVTVFGRAFCAAHC